MRSRTIKPGFYDNEVLGSISPLAHLLFPGLWQMADHEGLMEYRPLRIKAKIFPYRDADVASLCDELEAGGLIDRYEVDGCMYLSVVGFLRHQRPHPNEKKIPSTIPKKTHQGTSKDIPSSVQGHTKDGSDTEQGPSEDAPNRAGSSGSSVIQDPPLPKNGASAPEGGKTERAQRKTKPNFQPIIDLWRSRCVPLGLPDILTVEGKRKTRLEACAADPTWMSRLDEAITALIENPFNLGTNDRKWKADIDYIVRIGKASELIEKHRANGKASVKNGGASHEVDPEAQEKRRQNAAKLQEIADARKSAGANLF